MSRKSLTAHKPRLFIGSSSEGRPLAEKLQIELGPQIESTPWWQGVFDPSGYTLETLIRKAPQFDYAVIVMTPDDLVRRREEILPGPRDNVVLELGLFLGMLGRQRTFVVCPSAPHVAMPSDLAGVTVVHYHEREDRNLQAAIGPAGSTIRDRVLGRNGASVSVGVTPTRVARTKIARRKRRRSLGEAFAQAPKRSYQLANISVTGALLETDGPVEIGHQLELELDLDGVTRVEVVAEVVRLQHPDWGQTGGVGVRFLDYRGDARKQIDAYVDSDAAVA